MKDDSNRVDSRTHPDCPSHLKNYDTLFRENPRAASLAWFRDAKFGLFMHYGVYSLIGRGEWVMFHEKIRVAEYEKLKDQFTAEKFDADFITDLALDAGMKYVTITTRHHDSFCLFETKETDFNSMEAPARRNLVRELVEACREKGLGIFFYYSYACDWRHPYFYPPEAGWRAARPNYDQPEPTYLWRKDEDFRHYIDFVHAPTTEVCNALSACGAYVLPHMCGDIVKTGIVDELLKMDIHGIMPGNLTQETVLDIRELKEKVGEKICIFDNINPNGPLLIGTPEEVAAETRAHLEKARGMSGYIFSTSGTSSPNTPKKNYLAMNREVLDFQWADR